LLPVLKSSKKSERDWLDVMLASDGDVAAQQAFVDEYELGGFTYVLSTSLGMTYQVGKLPFAVLIDHDGVIRAKGLVNSREHLESLFEAKERGVASVQEYVAGKGE
jgi:methylamine dehydrogenase accessory protein MauD